MAQCKTQRWRRLHTCLRGAMVATPTRTTSLEVKFISQPIRFTEELQLVMWEDLIFLMPYQSESTLSGFPMLSGLQMNLTQSSLSANPQPQPSKCIFTSSSASAALTSIWRFSQGQKTNGKNTGWSNSPTCVPENSVLVLFQHGSWWSFSMTTTSLEEN